MQVFILISVFQISSIAKELAQNKYKDGLRYCSEAGSINECVIIYQELNEEEGFQEQAFKLQEMACDFRPESCDSALATAEMKFPSKVETIFQKLVSQCNRNSVFCGRLARVYTERRMPALALEAYRKDFEKIGHISYAFELRDQKKDPKLIEKVVEQACDRDADSCISAVKSFRNHPKHQKFVAKIELICEQASPESGGLSECIEVGGGLLQKTKLRKGILILAEVL